MHLAALRFGTGVGGVAVLVLSAFIADADAFVVVAFAMCPWLSEQSMLCYGSVSAYVEVVWNAFVALQDRSYPEFLYCYILVWIRHRRVDDD